MSLTKTASSALSKIDEFDFENLDFIGQKYPNVSAGHKAILYLAIAGLNIPAQSAWAAMSLVVVPVSVMVTAAAMGLGMVIKSASNDAAEQSDEDDVVDVDATEVIGAQTRLTAVEAEAEPVYEPNPFVSSNVVKRRDYYEGDVYASPEDRAAQDIASVSAIVETVPDLIKPNKQPMDIAKYMAMNLKPTLVSAVPRSGKGMVQAQMWREFKQIHPNGLVWVIQPKPSESELGYWEGVDNFWGEMIESALGKPAEITRISKELTKFIETWRQQPQRPKLLIIDEAVKIQSVLKSWYSNFLVPTIQVEASSGETDERYLHVVSQSPLVKDIGISTGNRASLQVLHIHKPGEDENLSVLRNSFTSIPEPESGIYELSDSPKGAIFYHSGIGEWYPMPTYPVYQREMTLAGSRRRDPVYPQKSVWDFPSLDTSPTPPVWDFEEEIQGAPELDAKIAEFSKFSDEPRYQCVVEFLESLKEHGNGTKLSPSDFGKSTWASRWNGKPDGLKDRSSSSVAVFLRNAVKLGFLKKVENEKYTVNLF